LKDLVFLEILQEVIIAPIIPDAAAMHVVIRVRETIAGSALSTEPPLNPNQPSQPPPHFQEPRIGYTSPTKKVVKMRNELSLILSATAPDTIVAAVAANIP